MILPSLSVTVRRDRRPTAAATRCSCESDDSDLQLSRPPTGLADTARATKSYFSTPSTAAVNLFVDEARRLAQIGHDEARVVPRRAALERHDFGLDHHAARATPRARAR